MKCPYCAQENVIKNGSNSARKQKYKCNECNRQFVLNPQKQPVSEEKKRLVEKLLLEKVPLAGIARAAEVSEGWLQNYVNKKYESTAKVVVVKKKSTKRLIIQCDEMWSFVGCKKNKIWIWLAIDVETKEIVGVYVGTRDKEGAEGLWSLLPPEYRQCAVSYTDFLISYNSVFPSKRHKSVGKGSGKTNAIERFNCTMRQRISRLVRKTLSFSKKLENHIGAIWNFIHYYNACLS